MASHNSNTLSSRRTPPKLKTDRDPNGWYKRLATGTRVHIRMTQKLGNNPRVIAHMGEYDADTGDRRDDFGRDAGARVSAMHDPVIGVYIRDDGGYFAIRVPRVGVVVFKREHEYLAPHERSRGTFDEGVVVLVV